MSTRRLLLVFAHPDDESFTSAVTIAKYAAKGVEISLVCATRGQAGSAGDPPLCSPGELPQVRERELREAAQILGIRHVEVLDYKDKHLSEVPQGILCEQIRQAIRSYRPQVVITFAPHGISGHPDHRAISSATSQAVRERSETLPVRKLYHCTIPSTSPQPPGRTLHTDPYEEITTEITAPTFVPTAARALLAHRTQHKSVEGVFPGITRGDLSRVRHVNHFILAWHNLPGYRIVGKENDLFAGIPASD
ncbi:MAG: PIG-L family deacetylase [Brevibacillus sp.]|nr:PIG-L family deacetylase [Brevibacillus sp.]